MDRKSRKISNKMAILVMIMVMVMMMTMVMFMLKTKPASEEFPTHPMTPDQP